MYVRSEQVSTRTMNSTKSPRPSWLDDKLYISSSALKLDRLLSKTSVRSKWSGSVTTNCAVGMWLRFENLTGDGTGKEFWNAQAEDPERRMLEANTTWDPRRYLRRFALKLERFVDANIQTLQGIIGAYKLWIESRLFFFFPQWFLISRSNSVEGKCDGGKKKTLLRLTLSQTKTSCYSHLSEMKNVTSRCDSYLLSWHQQPKESAGSCLPLRHLRLKLLRNRDFSVRKRKASSTDQSMQLTYVLPGSTRYVTGPGRCLTNIAKPSVSRILQRHRLRRKQSSLNFIMSLSL